MRAPWCCRDTGCTSSDHRAHSLANDRPTEPIELRQEPRATHEHRHDGRANYLSSRGLLHQRVRVSEWVCVRRWLWSSRRGAVTWAATPAARSRASCAPPRVGGSPPGCAALRGVAPRHELMMVPSSGKQRHEQQQQQQQRLRRGRECRTLLLLVREHDADHARDDDGRRHDGMLLDPVDDARHDIGLRVATWRGEGTGLGRDGWRGSLRGVAATRERREWRPTHLRSTTTTTAMATRPTTSMRDATRVAE